jgi:hypothetical protein
VKEKSNGEILLDDSPAIYHEVWDSINQAYLGDHAELLELYFSSVLKKHGDL